VLGSRWTWIVAALSVAAFGLLFPLQNSLSELPMHHHGSASFDSHLYGMWFAFSLVACLVAFFLTRLTRELGREREERFRLETKTLKQDKVLALTNLAAGAAHELNTPLATIQLVARELQLAFAGSELGARHAGDLELIVSQVSRCAGVLEGLSEGAGELKGTMPEKFYLEQVLEDLRADFQKRLSAQHQQEVRVEGNCKFELVLPKRGLEQALGILVQNGIDASTAGGEIVIEATLLEDRVEISVRDRGRGMSPEILARVGEPFFSAKEKGLGLGVFLVKQFVEGCQGDLSYISDARLGTRAMLSLPKNVMQQPVFEYRRAP